MTGKLISLSAHRITRAKCTCGEAMRALGKHGMTCPVTLARADAMDEIVEDAARTDGMLRPSMLPQIFNRAWRSRHLIYRPAIDAVLVPGGPVRVMTSCGRLLRGWIYDRACWDSREVCRRCRLQYARRPSSASERWP